MIAWSSEYPVQYVVSSTSRELNKNETELVDWMIYWLIFDGSYYSSLCISGVYTRRHRIAHPLRSWWSRCFFFVFF
jgi:hypothetical protein